VFIGLLGYWVIFIPFLLPDHLTNTSGVYLYFEVFTLNASEVQKEQYFKELKSRKRPPIGPF
jgi:hypothetical protein